MRIWVRTDGPWSFEADNSNGDIEMLEYADASGMASPCPLVLHDEADREFDYTAGAEQALEHAAESGWAVASIEND